MAKSDLIEKFIRPTLIGESSHF